MSNNTYYRIQSKLIDVVRVFPTAGCIELQALIHPDGELKYHNIKHAYLLENSTKQGIDVSQWLGWEEQIYFLKFMP